MIAKLQKAVSFWTDREKKKVKILGMSMIFFTALIFAYSRNRRTDEGILIFEELHSFIKQIRIDIGCYLKPIGEIRSASPRLAELGFFFDIEKYGVSKAYDRLEEKLFLKEKERGIFKRYFSSLGKGYAEDEIKLTDAVLLELAEVHARDRIGAVERRDNLRHHAL